MKHVGTCRLCQNYGPLEHSHIIPRFVFKWFKETSATGYMRWGRTPNIRSQDGPKQYLLCRACEDRFVAWETEVARSVFYPLHNEDVLNFSYSPWFLKFCVSVSWRVLEYSKDEGGLSHFPNSIRTEADKAAERWRRVLLDESAHPAQYEQHVLRLGHVTGTNYATPPKNLNRYFLRCVDIDTVHTGDGAFVFTKMARLAVIGVLCPAPRWHWHGTAIHVKGGVTDPLPCKLPDGFGGYLLDRARRVGSLKSRISPQQQERIAHTYSRNMDRAAHSKTFEAIHADVALFGFEAFDEDTRVDP